MIVLIDYDAGNTCSVMNALDRLEVDYLLTDNPEEIQRAEKVIFPGVGHAGAAMEALRSKSLIPVIKSLQQPVLGICVGMQLLGSWSEEGDTKCLGLIDAKVQRFNEKDQIKVPHMGWNKTKIDISNALFKDLNPDGYYYFVHSYYMEITDHTIASCSYGNTFSSAVQKDNFWGIQFHAEKSGQLGSKLLMNFIKS